MLPPTEIPCIHNQAYILGSNILVTRAAYRYTIRSRYRYYPIPIQVIEMTNSKRYSKSILTSSIWEKSNNNITKYHSANHKIVVYSNKWGNSICEHCPGELCSSFLYTLLLQRHIAVGCVCVWCSWWQFPTFQCRIASLWIIWLCGYHDMDRIDIGIEMWYQYWYRYRKICNDMQPYSLLNTLMQYKHIIFNQIQICSYFYIIHICWMKRVIQIHRADSRLAPSQWEMALRCNVSLWLVASLE